MTLFFPDWILSFVVVFLQTKSLLPCPLKTSLLPIFILNFPLIHPNSSTLPLLQIAYILLYIIYMFLTSCANFSTGPFFMGGIINYHYYYFFLLTFIFFNRHRHSFMSFVLLLVCLLNHETTSEFGNTYRNCSQECSAPLLLFVNEIIEELHEAFLSLKVSEVGKCL